jgi:hypothetical protein
MAKDILGNTLKIGDKLFFQGVVYDVEDIQENRLIGGKTMTGKSIQGMKIPDALTLRVTLPFDSNQPFNGFVVKNPEQPNQDAKPN